MNLKEFVSQSIKDIYGGMVESAEEINKQHGKPLIGYGSHELKQMSGINRKPEDRIKFELSVFVDNKNEITVDGGIQGGMNVGVASGSVDIDGKFSKQQQQGHKHIISFTVPYYPLFSS